MRFRNTLILAVVVALLGAYVVWVEKPAMEREEQESKLLDFDNAKVTGLSIETAKGKVDLVRADPGGWTITAPRPMAADTVAVDGILDTIKSADVKKRLDEKPADLAPFGLDKPESTVVLTLAGGGSRKLAFGKKTPIGGSAYARRDDEPTVLLTADNVRAMMQRGGLDDLRDKSVVSFTDNDVKSVTISGVEGEPTVLTKDGNEWSVTAPLHAKADASQVRSLLASLRSLRATGFVDGVATPPDAKYQLSPPRLTLELVLAPDDTKKTLLIGGATEEPAKKEIYAQTLPGDTVYVVGSHLYSIAAKRAMDFRDKTVLALAKDKIRAVTSERRDGAGFRLEKRDDTWSVADAGTTGVKEFLLSRFVDDLRELKGTDIASETGPRPEFGLDQPAIKIVAEGADGPLGTIRVNVVGEGADKKIYAAADGSQTVYLLQDFVFQRVDKKRSDFLLVPTPTPAAGATAGTAAGADGDDDPEQPVAAGDEDGGGE
ncbi:DUF4340 domain-containing protein [Candidatus Binatia bacterium]|nr:DUF4340 domain-containing protein [Candidatus Binatia bacterium]